MTNKTAESHAAENRADAAVEQSMHAPATTQATRRLLQLDFLRGIAILLVLGAHQLGLPSGKLRLVAGLLGRFGWSGVDLFFVLSGFLVGGLICRELVTKQSFDAPRFMVRRAFKIWPSYYLYLLVAAGIIFYQDRPNFAHHLVAVFVPAFFNYQNLSYSFYEGIGHIWPPMGMTWSLAIEEHFYILLPLICLLLLKSKSPTRALQLIAQGCFACIITCTVLRFILLWNKPFNFYMNVWPTYLRIDGLSFGVFLAYLYHAQPDRWNSLKKYRHGMLAASFFLLLPMVLYSHEKSRFVYTLGYTFVYLGYGGLLVVLMQTTVGQGRLGSLIGSPLGRMVAVTGRASYSIYLWQLLLAGKLLNHFSYLIPFKSNPTLHWLLATSLLVLLSIFEGILIARLVEVPTLLIRDRLFPGRAKAIKTVNAS